MEYQQLADWLKSKADKTQLPPDFFEDTKLYDHNPDPLYDRGNFEYLGPLPNVRSTDVKKSALSIGFETLDRKTFEPRYTFDLLGQSGAKFARCQTGWIRCEKEKGIYDFAWLDEVVDNLAARGIETWFSLSFGNPLYTPNAKFDERIKSDTAAGKMVQGEARGYVGETPLYHGESGMTGWCNYVKALTKHFLGRVKVFEVWNEPEGLRFWHFGETKNRQTLGVDQAAADYTEFVRLTGNAVKSVNPEAKIAAVVAQTGTTYIKAMGKYKLGNCIDIFCYHFYGNQPEQFMTQRYNHILSCIGIPGKKLVLWQGESGHASGLSSLMTMQSEYNQAKYLIRRLAIDVAMGAEVSSIFTVTDFICYYPDGRDQYYGIIKGKDHTPKLGFWAFQGMGWIMDGLEKAEDIACFLLPPCRRRGFVSNLPYTVECRAYRRKGKPVFAVWVPENVGINVNALEGVLNVVIEEGAELKHPVAIDPMRRKVYALRQMPLPDYCRDNTFGGRTFSNDLFIGAQFFDHFPVTDYPIFVADADVFDGE